MAAINDLAGSTRRILKATYVPLRAAAATDKPGAALQKYGFVRKLSLQPGEVNAVHAAMKASGAVPSHPGFWKQLARFEAAATTSQKPGLNTLAHTPTADLVAFGTALTAFRQDKHNTSAIPAPPPVAGKHSTHARAKPKSSPTRIGIALRPTAPAQDPAAARGSPAVSARALMRLTATAAAATNALSQTIDVTPIGMLNLERIEMTPMGIQRGELVATIPLAPLEQTSVVQKEWSWTSREFTSIVTDSLENYSETGVTENTELAQSTTSQIQHSSQFNISATVSGGCGFVTGSISSGFAAQDAHSTSATDSAKHAVATTKKASSRVKQEHKVTISTTTVTGTSESATRTLTNPSPTDSIRIDYFSIMRKWYVGLYRYGLRLTYDIVIPEPGALMRTLYSDLAALQAQSATGFSFAEAPKDITPTTLPDLVKKYSAIVPTRPLDTIHFVITHPMDNLGDTAHPHYEAVTFDLDTRYVVVVDTATPAQSSTQTVDYVLDDQGYGNPHGAQLDCLEDDLSGQESTNLLTNVSAQQSYTSNLSGLAGLTGPLQVTYRHQLIAAATMRLTIWATLSAQAIADWQNQAWAALYNAAQTTFYAQQQVVTAQIQALQARISASDTLTLRREEHDEIMRGAVEWILGPNFGFSFMPDAAVAALAGASPPTPGQSNAEQWGMVAPSMGSVPPAFPWNTVANYEQVVRFINDAIDWDNVFYFLYSYFWDLPAAWENIRSIEHPDPTRQAFLRAGSARVVLTVRKGWETAWVNFAETGVLDSAPGAASPYLSIASEIQDYDTTNYPGIPPANPGGSAPPDDGHYAATASSDDKTLVGPANTPVTLSVVSSDGFIKGYTAIIDVWEPYPPGSQLQRVQEAQRIVDIPDPTHITVAMLTKAHNGSTTPFPIIQAGEKGILISEWCEYTPSSGTDIAVTSALPTTLLA